MKDKTNKNLDYQKLTNFLKEHFGTQIVNGSPELLKELRKFDEYYKIFNSTYYTKWLPKFKIIKELDGVNLNTRCYQFVEDNEVIKQYFAHLFRNKEESEIKVGRKTDKYHLDVKTKLINRVAVKLFWNIANPDEEIEFMRDDEEDNIVKMNFYMKDGSNKLDDLKLTCYINFFIIKKEFDFNIKEKTYFLASFLETKEEQEFFFETVLKNSKFDETEFQATINKAENTEIEVVDDEDEDF